jgi:HD-like signal output (HDOD) protein/ActR/RegA family two-component response regulator
MSQLEKQKQRRKVILFVDDEPAILETFQMVFEFLNDDWEPHFAASGPEALKLLSQQPFQVIISDMRMPGMNGAQLMTEVMAKYPKTARLILSGYAEQEAVAKCVGAAHQFLMKPCDVTTLRNTLSRVLALDVFIDNEKTKGLVSQMGVLPSLPSLYFRIMKELQSSNASIEAIADIVSMDPAMTAKILQLVNSAFFGISRKICSPLEAIQFLGLGTVRSLALTIHAFSCFEETRLSEFSMAEVWPHCLRVAQFAKRFVQMESKDFVMAEEAFIAGLLHDLGKLMLASNMPEQFKAAMVLSKENNISMAAAELEVFGATHGDVAGYLLGLWGVPASIVEAVALHIKQGMQVNPQMSPLTAVHLANFFDESLSGAMRDLTVSPLDESYLRTLGVLHKLDTWKSMYQNSLEEALSA